ncbi:carbohydrate kinase family protein [Acuticoccus sp. I52.16.1]|uniref:carbohydrate kinase family protein n=1 Tax=Acuticoccus sp. I52.16.1 TaxID=2928472 RepID=UPI001FD59B78|nr:PfkB family carbohydrate kinase [Acuticoccus sp. I52.16.1]UOM35233.1 PfkB family carbohydrate kinase [Acuticoccus sp. I52.16.1]
MRPDLVTVGGLTRDNVVAADGTVALAQAGGNGAYSAVGALVWRPRVGLVSQAVATYPREVIARLEAGGVDLAGVIWSDVALSSCNWFIYDAGGHRQEGLTSPPEALAAAGYPADRLSPAEVKAWREHLAARDTSAELTYSQFRNTHGLTPAQVPTEWHGVRGVHLAPSQPDVMMGMLDLFAPGGAIVTADPGWQLAARTLDEITPVLARLDAFLPSEVELRALVPGSGLAEALAAVAERCRGAVAVKLGPEGVMVWDRVAGEGVTVPAFRVATVDPTGAGDSFSGGFLAGLVETGDPVQAARFGALSASRVVQHFGADGALPVDRASARAALNLERTRCL